MGRKILLVEDDPFLSGMYATKLEQAKFEVETANDGKKALEAIKKIKPDLVLLDLVLPEMDGYTVLENVRKDEEIKDTKIVILSNLGEKEDIEKGLKAGSDGYIIKSHYTPTEVVAEVNRLLKTINEKQ